MVVEIEEEEEVAMDKAEVDAEKHKEGKEAGGARPAPPPPRFTCYHKYRCRGLVTLVALSRTMTHRGYRLQKVQRPGAGTPGGSVWQTGNVA